MAQPFARLRAGSTAILMIGCTVTLLLPVSRTPLAVLCVGYVLVLATGRTRLDWTSALPTAPLIRIAIRIGIFFLPLVALGLPSLTWSTPGVACAVALAGVGLAVERREIRISLNPVLLRSAPYRNKIGRIRDITVFVGSGFAQEYFYRGVALTALVPLIGLWAVPVAAALFVAEHAGQAGEVYDRHDFLWHSALGLGLGTIVLITGSLPAAVIGHVLYNAPNVAQAVMRPGSTTADAPTPREVTP